MNARSHEFELTVEFRQVEEAVSCVFHTLLLHRTFGKFEYHSESNYSIGSLGTQDIECNSIDLTYVRVNSLDLARHLKAEVQAFAQRLTFPLQCRGGHLYRPRSYTTVQTLLDSLDEEPFLVGRTSAPLSPVKTESFSSLDTASHSLPQIRTRSRISLEFCQKRKRQWPLADDVIPYEIWQLNVQVLPQMHDSEFIKLRESVADELSEILFSCCAAINKQPQYLPKMPVRSDVQSVFDTRFQLVQPYLFRIWYGPVSVVNGKGNEYQTQPGSSDSGPNIEGISTTVRKLLKDTLSF